MKWRVLSCVASGSGVLPPASPAVLRKAARGGGPPYGVTPSPPTTSVETALRIPERKNCSKKLTVFSLLFFIAVPIAGCVSYQVLPIVGDRWEAEGFSFSPPRGDYWRVVVPPYKPFNYSFGRLPVESVQRVTQPTVTATVRVFVMPPDEEVKVFFQAYREWKAKDIGGYRLRSITLKFSEDKSFGSECIRYKGTSEDRNVPQSPGTLFLLSFSGLSCLHPDFPMIIEMESSQRRGEVEQPLPIEDECEAFLKSLVFKPIKKQKAVKD